MKKTLLSFGLFLFTAISTFAQLDCNDSYSNTLDANGEAEVLISDLVPNIEFMLTQGTVTYFVFPWSTGTITSADDMISLTCDNRGVTSYLIEVNSGGTLIYNCSENMVITSPNGGCEGDNPDICGDEPDCLKIRSGKFITGEPEQEIFAIDYALCSGVCGYYTIAYGLVSDAASLNFTSSISSAGATNYENPVTIFYFDGVTSAFLQSYLYVWNNGDCLVQSGFKTSFELETDGELGITSDDFLTVDIDCETIELQITEIDDSAPLTYVPDLILNCDDVGQRKIWARNTETGFVVGKIVQISDPEEACGTVLGPGDRLVSYTKSIEGTFFNTDILLNGNVLPRHPGGIGYVINEDDLIEGTNTLFFSSQNFTLNGVSTLDLVFGQRIILLDEYDHPRESILFDVDMSGYNGIGDMISMREFILGIDNGEGVPEAYFFNNSFEFSVDFDPFNFDNNFTEFSFEKADFETVDLSFEAYKVGDVSGNAIPGLIDKGNWAIETRSDDAGFLISDIEVEAGQEFTFELKCKSEMNFLGLLVGLVGDGVEFISMNKDELNQENPLVDFNIINNNEIRILYADHSVIANVNEITFTISARSQKSGLLIDLLGLKSGFPQEIIGEDNVVSPVDDLDVITTSVTVVGLDAEINLYPNPAQNSITLSTLDAELKSVSIIDALGNQALSQSLDSSGKTIDISNLARGLYHMLITTDVGVQATSFVKE